MGNFMSTWLAIGYQIKHHFWVCLLVLLGELAFELVDFVKQMVLLNMGGHRPIH